MLLCVCVGWGRGGVGGGCLRVYVGAESGCRCKEGFVGAPVCV